MIFAAGLGTRLRPLTNDRPKALVEINGITMLEMAIRKLESFGFDYIVVNIHHFADKMRQFLQSKNWKAEIVISDESDELLETGGGLKKAKKLLTQTPEPFLIYNVDVATDLDLGKLMQNHLKNAHNLATLAVRDAGTSNRRFLVNDNQLAGWENLRTHEQIISRKAENYHAVGFCGIHVVSPKIFPLITETGKFSITQTYLRLAQNHTFQTVFFDDYWIDLGKPENITAFLRRG